MVRVVLPGLENGIDTNQKLKKADQLQSINQAVLQQLEPEEASVQVVPIQLLVDQPANESKLDEM
jgi:hypothetical protein